MYEVHMYHFYEKCPILVIKRHSRSVDLYERSAEQERLLIDDIIKIRKKIKILKSKERKNNSIANNIFY